MYDDLDVVVASYNRALPFLISVNRFIVPRHSLESKTHIPPSTRPHFLVPRYVHRLKRLEWPCRHSLFVASRPEGGMRGYCFVLQSYLVTICCPDRAFLPYCPAESLCGSRESENQPENMSRFLIFVTVVVFVFNQVEIVCSAPSPLHPRVPAKSSG